MGLRTSSSRPSAVVRSYNGSLQLQHTMAHPHVAASSAACHHPTFAHARIQSQQIDPLHRDCSDELAQARSELAVPTT